MGEPEAARSYRSDGDIAIMWYHESIGILNALHCRLTVPTGDSVIVVTKQEL
jgi:hypothetical protein